MKTKVYLENLIREYNLFSENKLMSPKLSITSFGSIILTDFALTKTDLKGLVKCSDFRCIMGGIHDDIDSLYISTEL